MNSPTLPFSISACAALLAGAALAIGPGTQGQQKPPASKPATQGKETPKDKPKDAGAPKKPDAKGDLVEVDGEWYTKDEKAKLDKGWKRLDLDWVSPEEVSNITDGKFKVQGKWVSESEADAAHSKDGDPWMVPTKHFLVIATIPRSQLMQLAKHAEATWDLMARVLGAEPKLQPREKFKIRILDGIDAGNEFANQAQGDVAHHTSVWAGYVADWDPEKPCVVIFDGEKGKDKSLGFSPLYTAHAVAHKCMEALIPDVDKAPLWIVEGIAGYADRYNSPQIRDWALQMLVKRGGVPKLNNFAKRFAFAADNPDGSQTKLHEASLIVAYYALTNDKADEAAFKKAVASFKKVKEREVYIDALLEKPDDLEKKLKKFAGL